MDCYSYINCFGIFASFSEIYLFIQFFYFYYALNIDNFIFSFVIIFHILFLRISSVFQLFLFYVLINKTKKVLFQILWMNRWMVETSEMDNVLKRFFKTWCIWRPVEGVIVKPECKRMLLIHMIMNLLF